MKRTVAAAMIAVLLAPAALADPEYARKMAELGEKVGAAGREIREAMTVDDYAAACVSSRREAKLMAEYVDMAYLHREALYSETSLTPEQLEMRSNERILPLILNAARMRKTSAELCAKVGATD